MKMKDMRSQILTLSKYYTPPEIAEYCFNKTLEVIGKENIWEIIESSAGNGAFLPFIERTGIRYSAFDIEPEGRGIFKQDFLRSEFAYVKGYKKGCLIGFNPPFGSGGLLYRRFYNQAVLLGDYISFILPITQLNNNQTLYKFNLVYSEDLGVINFSDRDVHCCLNIYVRNEDGTLNKKTNYTLEDISIYRFDRGAPNTKVNKMEHFDFAICTWGNGSCGKYPEFIGQFAQEHYFVINNLELKDKILEVCYNTNWKEDVAPKNSSSSKLESWRIYKYLKEQLPELK